jgi:hypothetical protein
MKKKPFVQKQVQGGQALTREQILSRCRPLPEKTIEVKGFGGSVRVHNLTFGQMSELRANAPDTETYKALLIAAVCADLSLEDAIKLQRGNGAAYAALYLAVENYLGTDFSDDEIKK